MLNRNKIGKNIKRNENLFKRFLITITFFILISSTIASVNPHILLVGDSTNDLPVERQETIMIYQKLISDGYPVVLLLGDNATAENIIKGMYGADAIIYIGHGSDLGYYNNDGGISKAPYSLPTVDDVGIWTSRNFLSEGVNPWGFNYNGEFIPPFKKGASVFFIHTCFATGWIEETLVANPDETIYKFNIPYVNAGANVYSSGYYQVYEGGFFDGVLGQELANGGKKSITFREANNLVTYDDMINTNYYREYEDMEFYTNENYGSLFIGNLDSYVLPHASECSEYDAEAAESWYNSGKPRDDPIYDESIILSTSQNTLESFFSDLFDLFFVFIESFIDIVFDI